MLRHEIDRARRLTIVTGSGALSQAEMLALFERATSDPAFDRAFNVLLDFRDVTDLDFGVEALRAMIVDAPVPPTTRRALVVRGALMFGIGRMYESLIDIELHGDLARVFRDDIEAATAWLVQP